MEGGLGILLLLLFEGKFACGEEGVKGGRGEVGERCACREEKRRGIKRREVQNRKGAMQIGND